MLRLGGLGFFADARSPTLDGWNLDSNTEAMKFWTLSELSEREVSARGVGGAAARQGTQYRRAM